MAEEKITQRARVISNEIRTWLEGVSGTFHIRDLYQWIPELSKTTADKRKISAYLAKMVKERLIDRNGKYGLYRKIDTDIERLDLLNANENPVDIWLPFNLTDYIEILPGNIIVISGEEDTGKTTLSLNIAWANRNKWDVHYFTSEMGKSELRKALNRFENTDLYEWTEKISFYSKSHGFQDFIKTGENKLNIIDFMEASGDEYVYVAGWIKAIHDKIIDNGAIAIICLQKPMGRDEAVGGRGTLEKPRLYLAVSRGQMKIVRAKNWASKINPRGLVINFKIVNGNELLPTSDWDKTDKWSL